MNNTDLIASLLEIASAKALEGYGCGLDRLDPDELEWYTSRVTETNMDDMADRLASAAWQAY